MKAIEDFDKTDAQSTFETGLQLLCTHAKLIALLPLEEWLKAFNHAETVGPFIDPTLYQKYLASGNGEVIKGLIEAALPLKQAVMRAQPK